MLLFMFLSYDMIPGDEGKVRCVGPDKEEADFMIKFEDIVAFATGAPYEPPLGFDPPPVILFQSKSPYPRANTCTNTIYLPMGSEATELGLERFMYYLSSGILNTAGFGLV